MGLSTESALLIAILCVVGAILATIVIAWLAYYFFFYDLGANGCSSYVTPWGHYNGDEWLGYGHGPVYTDRKLKNTMVHGATAAAMSAR